MEDFNPHPRFWSHWTLPWTVLPPMLYLFRQRRYRQSRPGNKLNNNSSSTGPASALLLERNLELRPQQSKTLCFLYGYAPQGFQIDDLVGNTQSIRQTMVASSTAWKTDGPRFACPPTLG